MSSFKIDLNPVTPYDFEKSMAILSDGEDDLSDYKDGKFFTVLRIGKKLSLLTLSSSGTIDNPKLTAEIKSNSSFNTKEKEDLKEKITSMFNLDLDLKPFYTAVRKIKDPILLNAARKLRGLKGPRTQSVFESLINSIIEQQISLNVAWSMETKLQRKFGEKLKIGGRTYLAFPTPEKLSKATVKELRRCGLSTRKAEYIIGVSKMASSGYDFEGLKDRKSEDIVETLDEIRGIGRWTAEMTIVRGMRKYDTVPIDDVGIKRLVGDYYRKGKRISSETLKNISDGWGEWKGLAIFYLLVASIMGFDLK